MAAERNHRLLAWYDSNRRPLPWRETRDPWAILVSEVMSQQTQISRVIPRWEAFMDRFPDPGSLAGADRAELIVLWQGLGYQRRAINLQRSASIIDQEGWPKTSERLRSLPGVGPYTAAAVACFAFDEPVAAVDTNLRRIISRWLGQAFPGSELSDVAAGLVAHDRAADWNQALMDLGSMVCRPADPLCDLCPVETWCSDPTIYEPPRPQTRYEGSVRQARATILRHVAACGEAPLGEIGGLDPDTVASAAGALVSEGMLDLSDGTARIR